MFRPATRLIARSSRALPRAAPTRRFLSTAPPSQKSRSWKSSAARWGLAGVVVYYYNTTDVFAEEPKYSVQSTPTTEEETETYQTIDEVSKQRSQRRAEEAAAKAVKEEKVTTTADQETVAPGSPQALEDEAGQQGAFNPETGEINWDCPCLGGMADGPCGEEFKAAFSCFVFSEEDPKGMDCIDKFKGMQTCFRQYPEIYGGELDPDDEENDEGVLAGQEQPISAEDSPSQDQIAAPKSRPASETMSSQPTEAGQRERASDALQQTKEQADELIPKASHDERQANESATGKAEKE